MSELSTLSSPQRRFYRHAAHHTVGLSGVTSTLYSSREPSSPFADSWDAEPSVPPLQVAIVTHPSRGPAAPALFERILRGRGNVRCHRVDFHNAEWNMPASADRVVVFASGLFLIAGGRTDLAFEALADERPRGDDEFRAEIEVTSAAAGHPITAGVAPFVARFRHDQLVHNGWDETCLLVGRTETEVFPVAWARSGHSPMFGALLGSPADFCRPEFVRLALNALDWVGLQ